MKRRNDLSQPRRRRRLDVSYDADAFGKFSTTSKTILGNDLSAVLC